MVDKQFFIDAQRVIELVESILTDEAMRFDEDLRRRVVRSTQSDPRSLMEAVGMIATTLRKGNQKGMALPWYEDLCVLSMKLAAESSDTAWDWYYLADCLAACADAVGNAQSSEDYRKKGSKAVETAAKVYESSGATSQTLQRNIDALRHRLNP